MLFVCLSLSSFLIDWMHFWRLLFLAFICFEATAARVFSEKGSSMVRILAVPLALFHDNLFEVEGDCIVGVLSDICHLGIEKAC